MQLFNRKIELITASGMIFSSDDGVRFNFSYSTLNKTGVPTAEIEILNLDKDLRNKIKEENCVFSIGYGDYLGDLVTGDISNIEIDETVLFDVVGSSEVFNKEYSNWYNKDVRENFIVEDIAKNNNIILEGSELLKDYKKSNGYTVKGTAIDSITYIAQNRGLGVTFKGKLLKIYNLKGEKTGNIILDITSGLTNVTKYNKKDNLGNVDTTYDYIIHAIPIPTLNKGSIFTVEHDDFSGQVNCVDFEISGGGNWKAKYYVKVV